MTEELLSAAVRNAADQAVHHDDLAGLTRSAAARRRRRRTVLAVPAAVVAVCAVIGVTALVRGPDPNIATRPASACTTPRQAVLPTWARTGFSDPAPVMPFVTSASGRLVAILFGDLTAPPAPDSGNKILWVASPDVNPGPAPADFQIDGRLEGGSMTMSTTVQGGPGPSGVEVPAPGCWLLDLTWGGYHDTIALNWAAS